MSFNVLVIAEDFTKDEFILLPLVSKMLAEKGKPNANVQVCRNPNPGGIGRCLDLAVVQEEIIPLYPMVHLFVLFIDRNGDAGRAARMTSLEEGLAPALGPGVRFLAEHAWQAVEVFILAGHDLPDDWRWPEIRSDADVKNTYFLNFTRTRATTHLPHDGRRKLMQQAIGNWPRIKSRCPEDVGRLLARMEGVLA